MATLVVIGYESEIKAEEVRLALLKMQQEYLIDLADAVVAVRDATASFLIGIHARARHPMRCQLCAASSCQANG